MKQKYCFFDKFKRFLKKIILFLFRTLPIKKNLIIFESNPDFSDNTYALYKFIRKEYPMYKCIWLCHSNHNIKQLDSNTMALYEKKALKKYYYMSICSRYFYTHIRAQDMKPRKKQKFYEIWHGSPGKKFNPILISNKSNDNIFVTPTQYTFDIYHKNYQMNTKNYILCNHPRNDFFDFNFDLIESNNAEKQFNISNYSKSIIWLPTFRRGKDKSKNLFDNFSIRMTLDEFYNLNSFLVKKRIQLIVKLHPMVVNAELSDYQKFSNIKFLTSFDLAKSGVQLYSLIGQCDALISDFSSVVYDFMQLDRPIGYVLCDLNKFESSATDGFIYDNIYDFIAGDTIYSYGDLCEFINKVSNNTDDYKEKRHKIAKMYVGNQIPGSICEYFCNIIKL